MSLFSVTLPGRPRPAAFVASILVAWLLLALIALGLRRGPIESDLASRATETVRQEVTSSAEVRFDGRDAVVSGTFASPEDAEAARQAAASVPGAASARLGDDVTITSVPAPPLVVAVDDGALVVTATVPDQQAREDLLAAAVSGSSGALTGDVTIDPDAAGPPVAGLAQLAESLTEVPGDHEVSVVGKTVVLSGFVPDEAAADDLGARVLAAVEQLVPGATLDNQLTAAPSAPAEPTAPAAPSAPAEPTTAATRPAAVPADPAAPAEPVEPPAAGPVDPAVALRERLASVLDGEAVTFGRSSAVIAPPVGALLDDVAAVLATGELVVEVAGHTDATGPATLNDRLSLLRAQAVVDRLVAVGVPADSVRAVGYGSAEPVAPNDTAAGRAANRRVEFVPQS